MKAIEFIYQENEIHFLVNPNDKHVMINATEMAKPFNKDVDKFLRLSSTKEFIKTLIDSENSKNIPPHVGGYFSEKNIIEGKRRGGTFMHRKLALKFASWLDVKFELWIIDTIDSLLFGNYQKHWEAHAEQEIARIKMNELKSEILKNPTPNLVMEYFSMEENVKQLKNAKTSAIRNQLKLFASE